MEFASFCESRNICDVAVNRLKLEAKPKTSGEHFLPTLCIYPSCSLVFLSRHTHTHTEGVANFL